MYERLKLFTMAVLVAFMCTYAAYGAEPDTLGVLYPQPPVGSISAVPEPIPTPMASPVPTSSPTPSPTMSTPTEVPPIEAVPTPAQEQPAEAVPAPYPEQPIPEPSDEIKQAASAFEKEVEKLVMKRLNTYVKNGGKGTIGIYIKELHSGFEYAYNAEKTNPDNPGEGYFNSASTCKLLSAAVMYYMNNCSKLELDKTYTDKVINSQYNLRKILPKMISHSVNDYFNITLRHLGAKQINETLKELGVKNSIVYSEIMPAQHSSVKNNISRYGISRSPRTTPKDLGYVLDLLYCGKTFGEENDKLFVKSLKDNIYSNRLPAGIGYKSPVAHKTGTSSGEGVYNDAGIIYLESNPYIMVVMSKGSGSSVQSLYRSIAVDVYNYMKKRTANQSSIPQ
ncbi:MAG TPA: serine hydrolase [Candidatus Nitrosocosmicus sp.]|nr:serine hydrolase [Candidatus Nitrosocosmicus sp.]